MKKVLLTIIVMLLPMLASADPVEIDGIWYNLIAKAKLAEVTHNPNGYNITGSLVIPASVKYNGEEYSVASIEDAKEDGYWNGVFANCGSITSVTLPNSLLRIGRFAFAGCSNLTDFVIPNGVKEIGNAAFYNCSITSVFIPSSLTKIESGAFGDCFNLNSVHIKDLEAWCKISFLNIPFSGTLGDKITTYHLYLNGEEIKDLVIPSSIKNIGSYTFYGCGYLNSIAIPNSVMSIENSAFYGCSGLTSIIIPNSVNNIDSYAFFGCSGLTSVNIPNSVKIIGLGAFEGCSGLTSVTISNIVTWIVEHCFYGCSSLTNITIPNSVTSIENSAFEGCSGLKSISIGENVSNIHQGAFVNCPELKDFYCTADNVPDTNSEAFKGSLIEYATLHVPSESLNEYSNADPWKNFKNIVAIGGDEIPDSPKCATPTISFKDGKLTFSCATEGVEYISEITAPAMTKKYDNEISLSSTYTVTVYATKAGYINSDKASIEIEANSGIKGDINGDGEVNVADHVELSEIILNQ